MPSSWLLHSAVGGGLLLLLGWAATARTAQPATRQRLGEWTILAALFLAVLSLQPTWWTVSVPLPAALAPAPAVASAEREPVAPIVNDTDSTPPQPPMAFVWVADDSLLPSEPAQAATPAPMVTSFPPAPDAVTAAETTRWTQWLVQHAVTILASLYALGVAVLLGRWLLGHFALWRLLRSTESAPMHIAKTLEDMVDTGASPRLLVSDRLRVPVSCGLLRPTIVLPRSVAEDADAETLRWVFAHELTHLERRDAWSCLLLAVGQAFFFYVPWFWWLRRQVRLCQEYVADAVAARAGQPVDYAQFLLRLTSAPLAPAGATGVSGHTSDLFRRITMLLQERNAMEKRCPRWWSLTTVVGLLTLAVFASGLAVQAAPAFMDMPKAVKKEATKTDEPKPAPKKGDDKKKEGDKQRIIIKNLEDLLKEMPEGKLDPATLEKLHKLVEQATELHKLPPQFNIPTPFVIPGQADQAEFQKAMEEWAKQFGDQQHRWQAFTPMFGMQPSRLGARLEKPSATLAEQLDLPRDRGLVIHDVTADSAAAKAGLKANDILMEFNGKPVPSDTRAFAKMIEDTKADTPVNVVVLRKGKKETIKGLSLPEAKRFEMRPWAINEFQPGNPPLHGRFVPAWGVGGAGGGVSVNIRRNNDDFAADYSEGGLRIHVTGKIDDGRATPSEIAITDGDTPKTYDRVDKVPEQYRDKVRNLLESAGKGTVRIEKRSDK